MHTGSAMKRSVFGAGLAAMLVFVAPAVAKQPAGRTFDAKGVTLRYFVQGAGEPVVLVHGLLASAKLNWDIPGITAAIAKDHQVIALDLPGHGGSDKPETEDAYGVQMAEDVILLMDHLKIKKAHIVGYSLGGMITVKLLTLHPERVRSATIGGMGWVRDGGRNLGLRDRVPMREDGGPIGACVKGMGRLSVTAAELKAIKVPTIVIIGDQDPLKRATVEPLREVRPDWPVVEIKSAGHMSCILKKEFTDAVAAWLLKNRQK
jgi:pimeloyl-ACP methyl ester carboxylesterase